jgi:hypothetical protein
MIHALQNEAEWGVSAGGGRPTRACAASHLHARRALRTLVNDNSSGARKCREARCERNNSNSHTVGLHKHGSSTKLRYTVPRTQTHLCNSTRQRLLCHSGTKAHLHKPSGRRPLYHSIAGTKTCLRNPTRRWHVRHSGTKAHLSNSDNTAITPFTGRC